MDTRTDFKSALACSIPQAETRLLLAVHRDIHSAILPLLDRQFASLACYRVESKGALLEALDERSWDLVISELEPGDFNALELHQLCAERGIDIPLLLIAGTGIEDLALQCLEHGIDQCILSREQDLRRLPHLVTMLLRRAATEQRRLSIEKDLLKSEERYHDIFDNTNDLIQCLASDGSFLYTNRVWRDTLGYTEEEVRSLTLLDVLHPDSMQCCQDRFERLKSGENLCQLEFKFVTKTGETVHLHGDCGSIIKEGEAVSTRGIFKNITETVKAEEALQASQARYQAMYENAPDIYTAINTEGTILSVNRIGARILGYQVEELIGQSAEKLIHPDDLPSVLTHIQKQFVSPDHDSGLEYRKIRKDGSLLWVHQRASLDPESRQPCLLVVCRDITDRRLLEDQLSYQASHDALTDLINRREFENRLRRLLISAEQHPGEHVLCYLDLDRFKIVNDTCGHVAGDELLRQVATLLTGQIRSRDTLARLGGDEFAVLMEHCPIERARDLADHIRIAIENFRFQWRERRFSLGVSIGLVPVQAGISLKDALNLADSACYAAKEKGRNRIHVYHPDDAPLAGQAGDSRWVASITTALENDLFCLYAQPIRACCGESTDYRCEILVRLREGDTIVLPGEFMPVAERYNLSPLLDRWVLDRLIRWFEVHRGCLDQINVCSINLSALSLCDEAFGDYVLQRLEASGIPPYKLCFEVTETAAISNLSQATGFIEALRRAGCHFALDDFGSGLSSFAYLKNLPVDIIKIDGSFVRNIASNDIDRLMVKSIYEIVSAMGKRVTAEYVETAEALGILQDIGVDFAQGFHLGRPVPLEQIASEIVTPKNAVL